MIRESTDFLGAFYDDSEIIDTDNLYVVAPLQMAVLRKCLVLLAIDFNNPCRAQYCHRDTCLPIQIFLRIFSQHMPRTCRSQKKALSVFRFHQKPQFGKNNNNNKNQTAAKNTNRAIGSKLPIGQHSSNNQEESAQDTQNSTWDEYFHPCKQNTYNNEHYYRFHLIFFA